MTRDEIIKELEEAILEVDGERVKNAAMKAVEVGVSFKDAVDNGLAVGLKKLGEKFESGEAFLPHLVMAGDQMDEAVEILKDNLPGDDDFKGTGTFVIGTVKGDIHDIGKNIVGVMLRVGGFKVIDIGVDVPSKDFLKAAKEHKADIIGASALLSTTQYEQKRLIELLESEGVRNNYKVMVGGGQVTQDWADKIGADGYGKDALEAVKVAMGLMGVENKKI